MQTIFSANRKHFRRPYYIRVYQHDGAYRYVRHSSRDERASYEAQRRQDWQRGWRRPYDAPTLYYINVRPLA